MAGDTKKVEYELTADGSQFMQTMKDAAASVTGVTGQVKESVAGVGEIFEKIQKPLLQMAAIIGGGAFFKEAIGVANKLNGEAMQLSKSLGITGTQAATLRTALGDIGSDVDTYTGAFQKFAKQVKSNEQGLHEMGIETRDSNGNLRDSNELFTEALTAVGQYKPGLDQTTAAMTLFGKGVDDVMTLQKLNNGVIDEAREKNEQLGMTLTKEGVASTKAYKAAMNDVGDVFEAVKNTVGKAVMPVFTELGQYFAESGPAVVERFKYALSGLVAVFRVVQAAVQTVAGVVFEVFSTIIDSAGNMADVFGKLMKGDFSGAVESAKAVGSRIGQGFKNAFMNFVDIGNGVDAKIKADLDRIWGKGTEVGAPKGGKNTMGDFGKTNGGQADKSEMQTFEAELSRRKAVIAEQGLAEGQFREMSKSDEAQYWREIKALRAKSDADRAAAAKKATDVELVMIKEGLEQKVAALRADEEIYKNNTDEKLRLEKQVQAMYQQGTKGYEESQARINAIQRQAIEQTRAVEQEKLAARRQAMLAEVNLDEQSAQYSEQLGIISHAQLLEAQQQFEQRRYQIAHDALLDRLADMALDPGRNPAEVARINTEIEALEQNHQARMGQIKNAMQLDGMQPMANVFKSAETQMAQSIQNMINGTQTLRQSMRSIWQSISQSVIGELSKMAAKEIAMWAMRKALTLAGIGTDAVKAGTGAAASQASIPIIGPGLALAAMATVFAAVSGMAGKVPNASAAGGFDIPHSVNPVVQTHAREMILPAKYADLIRGMADGGGGAAGGGDVHNWHISAMDARSFESFLRGGGSDKIVRALAERSRNGG